MMRCKAVKALLLTLAMLANVEAAQVTRYQTTMPLELGIAFYASGIMGNAAYPYILSVTLPDLVPGEILAVSSECVVSIGAAPVYNYPGYDKSAFMNGQIVLVNTQPNNSSNWQVTWRGSQPVDGVAVSQVGGQDVWGTTAAGSGQYNPYYKHHFASSYVVRAAGTKYMALVLWGSSYTASSTDWILVPPGQCEMNVLRFTP